MNIKERIESEFSEKELLEITRKLISIPSHTIYPQREIKVAEYLLELFSKESIDCYLQTADGERCNIVATLKGKGGGKSLMLNGHTDTVPVTDMENPFDGIIKDGYLFGRGSADMKGGLAAMAYAVILIKRSGIILDGDLVFTGVIDEEAAKSTGARVIATEGPITDFAIVGEPTKLCPVIAHKGIDYFEINFTGKAAHSSNPDNGVNAIFAAADYVNLIRNGLVQEYKQMTHPLVGEPTINVGLMIGAAKINHGFLLGQSETFAGVVPDSATVYLDVRWTPYQTVEGIMEQLQNVADTVLLNNPGMKIEVVYIPLPRPAMEISANTSLTYALVKHIKEYSPNTAVPQGVSYFADSGILFGVGKIPSLIFGPGDIAYAHSNDERVLIDELNKATLIYAQTAIDVCCEV